MKLKFKFTISLFSVALLAIAGCATGIRSNNQLPTKNQEVFSSKTPVVITSTPAGNFATNKQLFVAFSHKMDAESLKNISVDGTSVNVRYDAKNRIAYLRPNAVLQSNHEYKITVPASVLSAEGVGVPVAHTLKVETRDTPNLSTPGVHVINVGCLPTNGSIRVIFDEDMDGTTINETTFLVAGVTGTVTYDAVTRIATFTPSAELTAGTSHTVTLTTGITDLGGKPLGSNFVFDITTCTGPGGQSFCSYSKGGYQGNGAPGQIFNDNFTFAFPAGMTIGVNDGGGPLHHEIWTSDSTGMTTLQSYLTSPAGGPSTALTTDRVNPGATASGSLSEQVAALTLNVHFSGTASSMPAGFGDLKLKNTGTSLDGATISAILAIADNSLAGEGLPVGYSFGSLNDLIANLNLSWDNCVQSDWAKEHLE
jgi:hypothetical protein